MVTLTSSQDSSSDGMATTSGAICPGLGRPGLGRTDSAHMHTVSAGAQVLLTRAERLSAMAPTRKSLETVRDSRYRRPRGNPSFCFSAQSIRSVCTDAPFDILLYGGCDIRQARSQGTSSSTEVVLHGDAIDKFNSTGSTHVASKDPHSLIPTNITLPLYMRAMAMPHRESFDLFGGAVRKVPSIANNELCKLSHSERYGRHLVLCIDDDVITHRIIHAVINRSTSCAASYLLHTCSNCADALAYLESIDVLPDIILADYMMPGMNGFEFCAHLRTRVPGNVLPIVIVSAMGDEATIVEGLKAGANDYIVKPFKKDELVARIESQLRLKNDSWWFAELVNESMVASDSWRHRRDGGKGAMHILRNILPDSIIKRMQCGENIVSDVHDCVVILFSDIVDFTSLASRYSVTDVFKVLSSLFVAFDRLSMFHGVFKVETIGDAYMVAAGHDGEEERRLRSPPATRVLNMARDMLEVVRNTVTPNQGEHLAIRIGIHCGPVVSGVIGLKSPRYCFIGDTVNTASRMQTTGFPMCVHVSDEFRRIVGNNELFADAGPRNIKGKGVMNTHFLRCGDWEEALKVREVRAEGRASSECAVDRMRDILSTF